MPAVGLGTTVGAQAGTVVLQHVAVWQAAAGEQDRAGDDRQPLDDAPLNLADITHHRAIRRHDQILDLSNLLMRIGIADNRAFVATVFEGFMDVGIIDAERDKRPIVARTGGDPDQAMVRHCHAAPDRGRIVHVPNVGEIAHLKQIRITSTPVIHVVDFAPEAYLLKPHQVEGVIRTQLIDTVAADVGGAHPAIAGRPGLQYRVGDRLRCDQLRHLLEVRTQGSGMLTHLTVIRAAGATGILGVPGEASIVQAGVELPRPVLGRPDTDEAVFVGVGSKLAATSRAARRHVDNGVGLPSLGGLDDDRGGTVGIGHSRAQRAGHRRHGGCMTLNRNTQENRCEKNRGKNLPLKSAPCHGRSPC